MVAMRVTSLPPVPYGATAVRPGWADLPADLRTAITARLGAQITWAAPATGGFTRGFAAVLDLAGGDRVFVKAADLVDQRHLSDWYAHEAAVTALLPPAVAAPRPRWTLTTAGHFAVCFDAVDGQVPALPWRPADLDATLAAWATTAAALREPPAELVTVGLPAMADLARNDLSWWQEIATGREPLPVTTPPYARPLVEELAALEQRLPDLLTAPGLLHGDLRLDNVLIDGRGAAWFVDWNWLCHGPAWFDTATLLVTAYASGLDADALFAGHPTGRDAPPQALDAALAALCGYWLSRAAAAPTGASEHLRPHQLWSGETTLDWLAARQGWR